MQPIPIGKTESAVDPTVEMATIEYNCSVYNQFSLPYIAYGLVAGLYIASLPGKYIWFSWHPLFMLIGFVSMAGNATLLKKIGG